MHSSGTRSCLILGCQTGSSDRGLLADSGGATQVIGNTSMLVNNRIRNGDAQRRVEPEATM